MDAVLEDVLGLTENGRKLPESTASFTSAFRWDVPVSTSSANAGAAARSSAETKTDRTVCLPCDPYASGRSASAAQRESCEHEARDRVHDEPDRREAEDARHVVDRRQRHHREEGEVRGDADRDAGEHRPRLRKPVTDREQRERDQRA